MKMNFLRLSKALLCFATLFLFGNKLYAQAPYCDAQYFQGCTLEGGINDFIVNGDAGTSINDAATGCTGGGGLPGSYYDDKTSMSITFSPGGTYTLNSSATASFPAPVDLQIWIDFDGSNTFDAGEEIGGGTYSLVGSTSFTLTIPSTATPGTHRMRACASGDEFYPSLSPCPTIGGNGIGETHDYTVVIVSACTAPTVTLGASTCTSQVVNWTAVPGSGIVYEYTVNTTATSPTGPGSATVATTFTQSGLLQGTTYYAHVRTDCGGGSFSSWVNVPFTTAGPGPISGTSALCPGSTTQLSNIASGGTWSSSNTAFATVNPTTGLVSGVAPGSVNITYTQSGCTSVLAVTVGNLPAIVGNTSVCPGSTTQLSDAVPGGTWSSSSPTVASVGTSTGLVTGGSGSGTTVITYSASGCSATVTVTVSPLPAITGGNSVCVGSTFALSNATAGGVWSSSNTSAATVNASGVVTGVSVGNSNIIYTLGGCSVNVAVTVGAAIAPITGTTTFCVTGGTTLADATAGGTWSSGNNSIATVNSTGAVSGVGAGSGVISYTVGSCSVTANITVDPSTVTISGADSVCKGAGHEVNLSSNSPGGTWSSSNTTRATVDPSTGVVTGVTSSTAFTITYTVTNSCGLLTATKAMYVRSAIKCATGVELNASNNTELKVFPNPNNGSFTVNLVSDINEDVHVIVTNIVGAKVKEFTTTTNTKTDLQIAVPKGIYLLSASSAHGTYMKKVIVD